MREHEIHIDDIDMNFVQLLITAVNEARGMNDAEKTRLRKTLDRWQNALTLTNKIRVTF